jgi:hypothetical protein
MDCYNKFNQGDNEEENLGGNPESLGEPTENKTVERRAIPELSFDLFREVEEIFDDILIAEINLEGIGNFQLIGMNELPMDRVMRLSHAKGERQIRVMREMINTCLVNPEDRTIIDNLTFEDFSELVQQWVIKSKGIIVDGDEEDE